MKTEDAPSRGIEPQSSNWVGWTQAFAIQRLSDEHVIARTV
jgi:hypothetical protein